MTLLPFSTAPKNDESGMSWLLRLTEGNLLRSPWPLLRLMGMDRPRVSHLRVDLGRVASLCGLAPESVESFKCTNVPGGRMIRFRGHTIQGHALRNSRPVMCPLCVRELGYARSVWDLRLVTACPRHRIKLVDRCGHCGNPLSWLRPRLDICRCGQTLSDTAAQPLEDSDLAVSAALECSLSGSTGPWTDSGWLANAVVDELATRSLAEALELVKWLARVSTGITTSSMRHDATSVASAAGRCLCDWPSGYHAALDAHIERRTKDSESGSASASVDSAANFALMQRRQVRRIAVMFGHGESALESEIVRYVRLRFADALLDTRVAAAMKVFGMEPRWISLQEASRRLRIDHRTTFRLIEEGRLASRRIERADATRYFVRAEDLQIEVAGMRMVALTNVTRLLGLPLSVLLDLRRSGTISRTSELGRVPGISQADIDDFRSRWAAVPRTAKPRGLETISLYDAFRSKAFGFSNGWKAETLRRVLAGRLLVYDVRIRPVLDAMVSPVELNEVMGDFRQLRLTLGGAGHALNLSKIGVLRLLVDGHLKAVLSETEIAFERSEVAKFAARYVQLSKVVGSANRIGAVVVACESERIECLRAGGGASATVFVPRESVKRLRKLLGAKFAVDDTPAATHPGFHLHRNKGGRPKATAV